MAPASLFAQSIAEIRGSASDERVVVTATRGSKAIEKIPGAISVISRQDLDDQLLIAEDPGQLLATLVPGYAPSRQKLTSFGESLRGRTALILFDGVPQTNPLRNGAREGYFADPGIIGRIEVVNGASAVQGLGATGGIINYISRKLQREGTQQSVDLKLSTQGRHRDRTWKAGWRVEHKHGSFDALMYLGSTTRGVAVDGEGRRLGIDTSQGDTQDSRSFDFFGKLGYDIDPQQRLQVSLNSYNLLGRGNWKPIAGDRSTGLPTSTERGTPAGIPPRNRVRTASLEWSHADLAGGLASAQLYKQRFHALYGAANAPSFQDAAIAPVGTLFDQSEIVADKTGLRLSWVQPDLGLHGLELTTGLDLLADTSGQRLAQTGRTWVPPLKFHSTAPFAQMEYERGPFTLRGGLRHESVRLAVDTYRTLASYGSREVQGGARSFQQWVRNLGAVWRLAGGWSVFAAYGEGFGLPDAGLVLRAVNRDNQSVARLIDLQPVLTDNREIGISWRGSAGSMTASIYDSRSDLGSQVRVDNATGIGSVQRLPVRVKGFEFAGELKPSAALTLSGTYAVTRGKTAASPGAPMDVDLGARTQGPDKLVLSARWSFQPNAVARLQASHLAPRHINKGRTVGTTQLEENFDGYTLADASMTWSTRWGEVGLAIENLFDRQYIGYYAQSNPSGIEDDFFAGRGRTVSVTWRRTF
ncbi:MAG TPA: TonB-dependent receptor [Burkholderiaceae bacterium]|nr:TonB-dependent receptor [Burkholderiaceae bacterium]